MPPAENKKRPRADLLSSLDAVFSSDAQPAASKYTALASVQTTAKGNNQQAYQHSKRKRKDKKREKSRNGQEGDKSIKHKVGFEMEKGKEVEVDPLYQKIDVEVLAIGLKDCSLHLQMKTSTNLRVYHEILKKYLESVTKGTKAGLNAVDSLKNKVLSLENPFKTTAAESTDKLIAVASRKQTAKLLSARRRRMLNLHMLNREITYGHAEQLNFIWTRYVSQVISSELNPVQPSCEEAQRTRNAKLQTKLKYLDLSGCRIEVIQSSNPCNVGLNGIIVAETKQTMQICRPTSSTGNNIQGHMSTLVKSHSRFRIIISPTRSLIIDGVWVAERT